MKAAYFEQFGSPIEIRDLPSPDPAPDGAVVRVEATGICRSDWHGWQGHDPDIHLPHVPGHELAGVIEAVGNQVQSWQPGDRVTVPFVCGCGGCPQCQTGNQQVCDHQEQPGFTHWGSFAEYVALRYADQNLVRLPEDVDYVDAASLGCRFVTSFRALLAQGRLQPGEWLAVHGCGGVGLAAIMIGAAVGARVVAVDIREEALALAAQIGAEQTINALDSDPVDAVGAATGGGAHVSIDALGHPSTCFNSVSCLRKRGRHVQVGLLLAEHSRPAIPMDRVVAHELEILGSHGMQAHEYPRMLAMVAAGTLDPSRLVTQRVDLAEGIDILTRMGDFATTGIAVIDRF
jgi:alcohol dehydrogenase